MHLASWLYPHFALTCPETIERLIIERDNLFRWQGLAILGGVSIAGKHHVVADSHSPADGGINTILRLAPTDDQTFDAACLQHLLQTRLMKGIRQWFERSGRRFEEYRLQVHSIQGTRINLRRAKAA